MQTAQRGIDAGVVERLLDQPFRFKFFQAVRVLETWFSKEEPVSDDRRDPGITFRNSLALTFPPSEIEHAVSYDEAGDVLAGPDAVRTALAQSKIERIELTPAFFGLLGGQGALPLHYTEQLIARAQVQRDHAAREFFDVFQAALQRSFMPRGKNTGCRFTTSSIATNATCRSCWRSPVYRTRPRARICKKDRAR